MPVTLMGGHKSFNGNQGRHLLNGAFTSLYSSSSIVHLRFRILEQFVHRADREGVTNSFFDHSFAKWNSADQAIDHVTVLTNRLEIEVRPRAGLQTEHHINPCP